MTVLPVTGMIKLLLNPDFALVLLSIAFVVFLSVIVWRMKNKQLIHHVFLGLMGCLFIWAIGAMLLLRDNLLGHPIQIWAVNFAYIGLILTPVAALYVGVVFAHNTVKLSPFHLLTLVIPFLSLFLLFTNEYHHVFYKFYDYAQLTSASALGWYFVIHTAYSYTCITIGLSFLAYFSIKNAGFFSKQSIFILTGVILSFGFNAAVTFQVIPARFHYTVIVLSLSCIFFYFAIFKYDFLSIVPIALQRVVDHISDSFMVFDANDNLVDFNKTFIDTFQSEANITRKITIDTLADRVRGNRSMFNLLRKFRAVVKRRMRLTLEETLDIKGQKRFFSIEVTPVYNQGRFISTIILLKDITEIREALDSLRRNHEMLMEKERLASLGQLIGGIAHNLKTPIMSISGGIEGLKDLIEEYEDSIGDSSVTAEDHHEIAREMLAWIDKIRPHCTYMSDIITTVKGQAAQFNTSDEMTFTLNELIHRVELLMKHELKRYHCVLNIHLKSSNIIELKGEINSLVQIFDNLIINALQSYEGRQGQLDLTIEENENQIIFMLKDYGSGISPSVRDKLFREMVTTKGKLGTGLGLYMSHATIKGKFGGRMWFDSEPGKGTCFFIELPLARSYPIPALTSTQRNGVPRYA